jgi:inhibitor of KinA
VAAATHARVRAACETIRRHLGDAITDLVPAYTTLSLWYDPSVWRFDDLARHVLALTEDSAPVDLPPGREWTIPVIYDGPDLPLVADRTGLTCEEVVARHAARWYHVLLLGFVPGFAFLGGLDPALALPRRSTPRLRVPAGSVGIAGEQTGIYPVETPGGWHLIGRTDVRLFDAARDPPALLQVGDRVRFEVVG